MLVRTSTSWRDWLYADGFPSPTFIFGPPLYLAACCRLQVQPEQLVRQDRLVQQDVQAHKVIGVDEQTCLGVSLNGGLH